VATDEGGHVLQFKEKPRLTDHWINAGVYCLQPSIADYLPRKGSLETDVFPVLAKERRLLSASFPSSFWMSVDSPKDMEEASAALSVRAVR
jgi:NDP-sugar pyrophosphorylase family protein